MSPKLPRVTGAEVLRALHRAGWYQDRRKGSHVFLRHADRSGLVVVAAHAGRTIPPGTLAAILEQAGLTADGFRELLQRETL